MPSNVLCFPLGRFLHLWEIIFFATWGVVWAARSRDLGKSHLLAQAALRHPGTFARQLTLLVQEQEKPARLSWLICLTGLRYASRGRARTAQHKSPGNKPPRIHGSKLKPELSPQAGREAADIEDYGDIGRIFADTGNHFAT